MSRIIDLTNKRFGAWLAMRFAGQNENKQTVWWCRCDCGTERLVVAQTLRMGLTNSCGCLKAAAIAKAKTKHGGAFLKSYQVWKDMVRRCTVPDAINWESYGGRGIKVCERWLKYENFREDMGEPQGLTIERKDNNGNYEPDNCVWDSWGAQAKNRRKRAK